MKFRQKLMGALAVPALLGMSGVPAFAQKAANSVKPATNEDILIYQAMGTSFFCMSALDGVEFPKALGISATTYAQALKGRHNGQVASLKGKTLTDKEIFAAAEQQVLLRAMQACPKAIPSDVQAKVKAALKKQGATK
ncbi:MAG: cAMP phosphodiesterase [Cyanobium sp. NAT70]|nr:cAMP phosphodiesterase [Cyanobium sp. NAT70]